MKCALFVTFVAFFAQLSLAVPPGCLLHAVNTQDEPSDFSAVCGDGALTVQQHMADNCGSTFEGDAQQAFIETCSSAGTSVAAYTATATGTATRSGSTGTGTSTVTGTARSSGSQTGSAGSVQSTAGANVDYRQVAMGPMAAAAVALVGAVAAL